MQISGLVFSGLTQDISGLAYPEKFISAHPWISAKKYRKLQSDGEFHLGQLANSYRK
jgi:hypothetical protein